MKLLYLTLMALVFGCSNLAYREIASTQELGQEEIPPEEAEATKEILDLVAKGYSHRQPTKKDPQVTRIIHAKGHGCVYAEVKVLPDIPKELQYGVLSKIKSYPAWVRLSNGSGSKQHDSIPDGRGLAIKLMNVEGEKLGNEKNTQDFLLQSAPNFFAKDVAAYVKFMKMAAHGGPKGIAEMLKDMNLKKKVDRKSVKILAQSSDNPRNPFTATYHSALPQKLGPHAMKLKAQSCKGFEGPKVRISKRFKKNYLKKAMVNHLSQTEACIELLVQVQVDAVKMPIEDAMVTWSEELSPFIPVAHIFIPQQSFDSEKRQSFCQQVSFNPWHSVEDHRPLGGLNRVRKLVYEHSQGHRHHLNRKVSFEPIQGENYE